MKKLVLLLALLSTPAWAAVAHVASSQGFCNAATSSNNMSGGGTCADPDKSTTIAYTPTGTSNGVLLFVSCNAQFATPSAVSLTASGWTTTQIGSIIGSTTAGFVAAFKAYSPNTSAATFTLTWTVATNGCGGFMNDLLDEFSGIDGANFVDASNSATATSTTSCNNVSVTPTVNDDGLWAACNDNQTAAAATWTVGANDTQSDISVWKILSGGSGVSQSPGFSSSTGTAYAVFMVAVKPAASGGATPTGNKADKLQNLEGAALR